MSVIIEGPNGCGKTTVGHRLANDLGLQFIRFPKKTASEVYQSILDSRYMAGRQSMVLDRFPALSESIYGRFPTTSTLTPCGPLIGPQGALSLLRHVVNRGSIFVYMWTNDRLQAYRRQHKMVHTFTEYLSITDMYESLTRNIIPRFDYCVDKRESYTDLKKFIENSFKKRGVER